MPTRALIAAAIVILAVVAIVAVILSRWISRREVEQRGFDVVDAPDPINSDRKRRRSEAQHERGTPIRAVVLDRYRGHLSAPARRLRARSQLRVVAGADSSPRYRDRMPRKSRNVSSSQHTCFAY
ncbi:MAG: hypothetical protein JWN40_3360 [Phycisphaerales bacterium]|nr:hypothetical protein [Phycisphaerales bacterium]